ncbi:hypothetical protein BH09MYX1_BH09MYX1_22840 [soil metagenome]
MDQPMGLLLRRGLKLAVLYTAAVALFLGALGIGITVALSAPKPGSVAPANAGASDTQAPSGSVKAHPSVPNGDKGVPSKPEI